MRAGLQSPESRSAVDVAQEVAARHVAARGHLLDLRIDCRRRCGEHQGWYGLLLVVYKVAGFSAYTAKLVRLALHALFLACSAYLLKRWLGLPRAFLPLLADRLSPTPLYFDNLERPNGTDIQLSAVVVLLIASIGEHPPRDGLAVRSRTPRPAPCRWSRPSLRLAIEPRSGRVTELDTSAFQSGRFPP